MGRKKKDASIGSSILKDRFGKTRSTAKDSFLHTSELQDGADWGRLNLQSVTEQSNLDEFLTTAELAGTEFTAERQNVTIIDGDRHAGLPTTEQQLLTHKAHEEHRELLKIPRRPGWDETTTADELEVKERDGFLEWRRKLAQLQENEQLILTPFERNLTFWRQLWRVIERSDVVVQIVDARNPLLFRCGDLEKYVKEVNGNKVNCILINKADLLSEKQRKYWAEYFDSINLNAAFWSAVKETERIAELEKEESKEDEEEVMDESDEGESESESEMEGQESQVNDNIPQVTPKPIQKEESKDEEDIDESEEDDRERESEMKGQESEVNENIPQVTPKPIQAPENKENAKDISTEKLKPVTSSQNSSRITDSTSETVEGVAQQLETVTTSDSNEQCESCGTEGGDDGGSTQSETSSGKCRNSYDLLTGDELITKLKDLHSGPTYTEGITTLGLVGYPNVGKSSSINAILQAKKVPVSATPGRTKHFQTLYVDKTTLLCDCPGLVMPTFVTTKAEMVISGILPIDQMRDHIPPTALVCSRIAKETLEATYGIILPPPGEGEDPARPPTAMELLAAYGYMRGYMTHKGIPDYARSARNVLKDYVKGKLLFAHPPPEVSEELFEPAAPPQKTVKVQKSDHTAQAKKKNSLYTNSVDQQFFEKTDVKMGKKGNQSQQAAGATGPASAYGVMLAGKKHGKKGKKEKLRRMHGHLDA